MTIQVLQRYTWNGEPKHLGDCFRLRKVKDDGRELRATCGLWSHEFGWELRLEVGAGAVRELQRSQVCRSQEDVLDTFEAWKAAMIEKGWQ